MEQWVGSKQLCWNCISYIMLHIRSNQKRSPVCVTTQPGHLIGFLSVAAYTIVYIPWDYRVFLLTSDVKTVVVSQHKALFICLWWCWHKQNDYCQSRACHPQLHMAHGDQHWQQAAVTGLCINYTTLLIIIAECTPPTYKSCLLVSTGLYYYSSPRQLLFTC